MARGGLTSRVEGCIWRAYTEAEVSHLLGYSLKFLTSPTTRQDKSTPYSPHDDPYLYNCTCKVKMHLLGWLTILHNCTTALAEHLATTNTHIMCKTPKTIVHMHTIVPCQTFCHSKCCSGVFSFFLFDYSPNFLPVSLSLAKWWDTTRTLTELRLFS